MDNEPEIITVPHLGLPDVATIIREDTHDSLPHCMDPSVADTDSAIENHKALRKAILRVYTLRSNVCC